MRCWLLSFLVVVVWLGQASSVHAQNVLDLLLGQSQGTGAQLQIKTPEAKLLMQSKERLKKVIVSIESLRKKHKERALLWEKETKAMREKIKEYQVQTGFSDWRNAPALIQLRAKLVATAEQNIHLISQLQAATASREQTLITLRDTLQNYQKTKKNIEKIVKDSYFIPKLHNKLRKDLETIREKMLVAKKELNDNKKEQQQLTVEYEKNQQNLDKSRRLLVQLFAKPKPRKREKPVVRNIKKKPAKPKGLKSKPGVPVRAPLIKTPETRKKAVTSPAVRRRVSPTAKRPGQRQASPPVRGDKTAPPKSTTRPVAPPVPRLLTEDEILQKRKKRYTRFLNGTVHKLLFDAHRLRGLWLRIRQRDETVEQEVGLWRIRMYTLIEGEMKDAWKDMVSHSRTGLWFRRKLRWDRDLFMATWRRSIAVVKEAPKQTNGVWLKLKSGWETLDHAGTLFLLFLSFCGIIALFVVTRRTRARLVQSMERLSAKAEHSSATKVVWLSLMVAFRSVYNLLPFFGVLLVIGALFWALAVPMSWRSMLWNLGFAWLGLLALSTFVQQLFSDDPQTRLLRNVSDEGARRFRRVIRVFIVFAFVYFPIVFTGEALGYPGAFIHLLRVAFYSFLVLNLLVLLLSKDVVISMIPADSVAGRATLLAIYRLYPLFFLLALGLFGVYAYGYSNFAAFLAWGLLRTALIIMGALVLYRLVWSLGLIFFGFSRESEGIVKIEKRWARNLLRLGRFLSGIILGLVSLSLLLEIWGVAGGFKTLLRVVNIPFLQIKDTQLSAVSLLKFGIALSVAIYLSRWIKQKATKYVYPALRMSRSNQHASNTVLVYSILIIGFLSGLQWMGMGLGVLTVFAGVIGIGIGFGLQNIASNFISGLMITFGKPIKVGDVIEVGSLVGEVKEISARSTTIETHDQRIVLIPNSDILTTKVINWSMGSPYIMVKLLVGVAYGSDVPLVMKTLKEVVHAHPKVLKEPTPMFRFDNFGTSSLDMAMWLFIHNPLDRFEVLSDLRIETDRRFREEHITISFPQQDIHIDDELQSAIVQSLLGEKSQGHVLVDVSK